MPDQPSLSGSAPLGAPVSPLPASAGPARSAFQAEQNMGAPHLQSQAPAGALPGAPLEAMQGGHLAPGYAPSSPSGGDPFSRVIDLPSGGIYYTDGTRQATIRPMRGEEELNISGTSPEGPDRSRAMREMVSRCVSLSGQLALEELTLLDYAAISMHLMAATAGTDELNVDASNGCGKDQCPLAKQPITMTSLPCVYLRRRTGQETEEDDLDPIIAAAMRTEAKLAAGEAGTPEDWGFGRKTRPVGPNYREPFTATLPGGYTVQWRHLRVKDQVAAEEFILETGASIDTDVKSALGSYLAARAIVSINGSKTSPVMALQWWRKAPSPILRELRKQQNQHTFGYEFRPQFRCSRSECKKEVAVQLPKDGSLFRPDRP